MRHWSQILWCNNTFSEINGKPYSRTTIDVFSVGADSSGLFAGKDI